MKNLLKNNFIIFFIFVTLSFNFSALAHADLKAPCKISANDGSCTTVSTGLGDIGTNFSGTISSLFLILLGFAGSIAVILIIFAGYNMMFSQGNPEKVKSAQETLTSAIIGLLFILFSGAILQIIGVDILKIHGFSK